LSTRRHARVAARAQALDLRKPRTYLPGRG
jgi:hypothetical protein